VNSYWNRLGQELDEGRIVVRFPIQADTFMYEIRDFHSIDVEGSGPLGRYAL
jgi:hypothetical protein